MDMSGPNNILSVDSQIVLGNDLHKRFLREMKHERDAAGMDIELAEKGETVCWCKWVFR